MTKVGNAFKIIKHHIPEANKVQLYYAYIYSKVRYGIEVYGRCKEQNIKKVQKLAKIGLSYTLDYLTHTLKLHKVVKDKHNLSIPKCVYKYLLFSTIFKDTNKTNQDVYNHNITILPGQITIILLCSN